MTGASRKALRLYEARGLLTRPDRTHTGWRRYARRTIEEVQFTRGAVAAGLRLDDLKPALEAWRGGKSACPSLTKAVELRAAQVDVQLRALTRQRDQLQTMLRERDCACATAAGVCAQLTEAGAACTGPGA